MAAVPQPTPAAPARMVERRAQIPMRGMWASLAISVIWITVLADALFGPDIISSNAGTNYARVPSAVVVALFAWLATWVIARHGFGAAGRDDGE